jgi:hypothetical protein
MVENSDRFLTTGIDWITVTAKSKKRCIALAEKAATLLRSEVHSGNFRKPWGMSGFSGFKAGSVQLGRRNDEVMVRVSGDLAHTNWRELYEISDNCSRIDLECTSRNTSDARRRIRRHWKEARRFGSQRRRAPFVGHFSGNDESETLYLGRRVSDIFIRIYDKGRQSKLEHFSNSVRYEVELKGERARAMAFDLSRTNSEMSTVISRVAGFLAKRGVHCPQHWAAAYHSGIARMPPDRARYLAWLTTAVRPSTLAVVSMGGLVEVLEALGLENLVEVRGFPVGHTSKGESSYVS